MGCGSSTVATTKYISTTDDIRIRMRKLQFGERARIEKVLREQISFVVNRHSEAVTTLEDSLGDFAYLIAQAQMARAEAKVASFGTKKEWTEPVAKVAMSPRIKSDHKRNQLGLHKRRFLYTKDLGMSKAEIELLKDAEKRKRNPEVSNSQVVSSDDEALKRAVHLKALGETEHSGSDWEGGSDATLAGDDAEMEAILLTAHQEGPDRSAEAEKVVRRHKQRDFYSKNRNSDNSQNNPNGKPFSAKQYNKFTRSWCKVLAYHFSGIAVKAENVHREGLLATALSSIAPQPSTRSAAAGAGYTATTAVVGLAPDIIAAAVGHRPSGVASQMYNASSSFSARGTESPSPTSTARSNQQVKVAPLRSLAPPTFIVGSQPASASNYNVGALDLPTNTSSSASPPLASIGVGPVLALPPLTIPSVSLGGDDTLAIEALATSLGGMMPLMPNMTLLLRAAEADERCLAELYARHAEQAKQERELYVSEMVELDAASMSFKRRGPGFKRPLHSSDNGINSPASAVATVPNPQPQATLTGMLPPPIKRLFSNVRTLVGSDSVENDLLLVNWPPSADAQSKPFQRASSSVNKLAVPSQSSRRKSSSSSRGPQSSYVNSLLPPRHGFIASSPVPLPLIDMAKSLHERAMAAVLAAEPKEHVHKRSSSNRGDGAANNTFILSMKADEVLGMVPPSSPSPSPHSLMQPTPVTASSTSMASKGATPRTAIMPNLVNGNGTPSTEGTTASAPFLATPSSKGVLRIATRKQALNTFGSHGVQIHFPDVIGRHSLSGKVQVAARGGAVVGGEIAASSLSESTKAALGAAVYAIGNDKISPAPDPVTSEQRQPFLPIPIRLQGSDETATASISTSPLRPFPAVAYDPITDTNPIADRIASSETVTLVVGSALPRPPPISVSTTVTDSEAKKLSTAIGIIERAYTMLLNVGSGKSFGGRDMDHSISSVKKFIIKTRLRQVLTEGHTIEGLVMRDGVVMTVASADKSRQKDDVKRRAAIGKTAIMHEHAEDGSPQELMMAAGGEAIGEDKALNGSGVDADGNLDVLSAPENDQASDSGEDEDNFTMASPTKGSPTYPFAGVFKSNHQLSPADAAEAAAKRARRLKHNPYGKPEDLFDLYTMPALPRGVDDLISDDIRTLVLAVENSIQISLSLMAPIICAWLVAWLTTTPLTQFTTRFHFEQLIKDFFHDKISAQRAQEMVVKDTRKSRRKTQKANKARGHPSAFDAFNDSLLNNVASQPEPTVPSARFAVTKSDSPSSQLQKFKSFLDGLHSMLIAEYEALNPSTEARRAHEEESTALHQIAKFNLAKVMSDAQGATSKNIASGEGAHSRANRASAVTLHSPTMSSASEEGTSGATTTGAMKMNSQQLTEGTALLQRGNNGSSSNGDGSAQAAMMASSTTADGEAYGGSGRRESRRRDKRLNSQSSATSVVGLLPDHMLPVAHIGHESNSSCSDEPLNSGRSDTMGPRADLQLEVGTAETTKDMAQASHSVPALSPLLYGDTATGSESSREVQSAAAKGGSPYLPNDLNSSSTNDKLLGASARKARRVSQVSSKSRLPPPPIDSKAIYHRPRSALEKAVLAGDAPMVNWRIATQDSVAHEISRSKTSIPISLGTMMAIPRYPSPSNAATAVTLTLLASGQPSPFKDTSSKSGSMGTSIHRRVMGGVYGLSEGSISQPPAYTTELFNLYKRLLWRRMVDKGMVVPLELLGLEARSVHSKAVGGAKLSRTTSSGNGKDLHSPLVPASPNFDRIPMSTGERPQPHNQQQQLPGRATGYGEVTNRDDGLNEDNNNAVPNKARVGPHSPSDPFDVEDLLASGMFPTSPPPTSKEALEAIAPSWLIAQQHQPYPIYKGLTVTSRFYIPSQKAMTAWRCDAESHLRELLWMRREFSLFEAEEEAAYEQFIKARDQMLEVVIDSIEATCHRSWPAFKEWVEKEKLKHTPVGGAQKNSNINSASHKPPSLFQAQSELQDRLALLNQRAHANESTVNVPPLTLMGATSNGNSNGQSQREDSSAPASFTSTGDELVAMKFPTLAASRPHTYMLDTKAGRELLSAAVDVSCLSGKLLLKREGGEVSVSAEPPIAAPIVLLNTSHSPSYEHPTNMDSHLNLFKGSGDRLGFHNNDSSSPIMSGHSKTSSALGVSAISFLHSDEALGGAGVAPFSRHVPPSPSPSTATGTPAPLAQPITGSANRVLAVGNLVNGNPLLMSQTVRSEVGTDDTSVSTVVHFTESLRFLAIVHATRRQHFASLPFYARSTPVASKPIAKWVLRYNERLRHKIFKSHPEWAVAALPEKSTKLKAANDQTLLRQTTEESSKRRSESNSIPSKHTLTSVLGARSKPIKLFRYYTERQQERRRLRIGKMRSAIVGLQSGTMAVTHTPKKSSLVSTVISEAAPKVAQLIDGSVNGTLGLNSVVPFTSSNRTTDRGASSALIIFNNSSNNGMGQSSVGKADPEVEGLVGLAVSHNESIESLISWEGDDDEDALHNGSGGNASTRFPKSLQKGINDIDSDWEADAGDGDHSAAAADKGRPTPIHVDPVAPSLDVPTMTPSNFCVDLSGEDGKQKEYLSCQWRMTKSPSSTSSPPEVSQLVLDFAKFQTFYRAVIKKAKEHYLQGDAESEEDEVEMEEEEEPVEGSEDTVAARILRNIAEKQDGPEVLKKAALMPYTIDRDMATHFFPCFQVGWADVDCTCYSGANSGRIHSDFGRNPLEGSTNPAATSPNGTMMPTSTFTPISDSRQKKEKYLRYVLERYVATNDPIAGMHSYDFALGYGTIPSLHQGLRDDEPLNPASPASPFSPGGWAVRQGEDVTCGGDNSYGDAVLKETAAYRNLLRLLKACGARIPPTIDLGASDVTQPPPKHELNGSASTTIVTVAGGPLQAIRARRSRTASSATEDDMATGTPFANDSATSEGEARAAAVAVAIPEWATPTPAFASSPRSMSILRELMSKLAARKARCKLVNINGRWYEEHIRLVTPVGKVAVEAVVRLRQGLDTFSGPEEAAAIDVLVARQLQSLEAAAIPSSMNDMTQQPSNLFNNSSRFSPLGGITSVNYGVHTTQAMNQLLASSFVYNSGVGSKSPLKGGGIVGSVTSTSYKVPPVSLSRAQQQQQRRESISSQSPLSTLNAFAHPQCIPDTAVSPKRRGTIDYGLAPGESLMLQTLLGTSQQTNNTTTNNQSSTPLPAHINPFTTKSAIVVEGIGSDDKLGMPFFLRNDTRGGSMRLSPKGSWAAKAGGHHQLNGSSNTKESPRLSFAAQVATAISSGDAENSTSTILGAIHRSRALTSLPKGKRQRFFGYQYSKLQATLEDAADDTLSVADSDTDGTAGGIATARRQTSVDSSKCEEGNRAPMERRNTTNPKRGAMNTSADAPGSGATTASGGGQLTLPSQHLGELSLTDILRSGPAVAATLVSPRGNDSAYPKEAPAADTTSRVSKGFSFNSDQLLATSGQHGGKSSNSTLTDRQPSTLGQLTSAKASGSGVIRRRSGVVTMIGNTPPPQGGTSDGKVGTQSDDVMADTGALFSGLVSASDTQPLAQIGNVPKSALATNKIQSALQPDALNAESPISGASPNSQQRGMARFSFLSFPGHTCISEETEELMQKVLDLPVP